jgi:predicted AAA+ superfamily ATPase
MMYAVNTLPAWTWTDYARISKRDKFFIADSGLMASLLHWNMNAIEMDPDRTGKLIETMVFNELYAQIAAHDPVIRLYHYRDHDNHEIDFIAENANGDLLGIEVKAETNVSKSDFKHLKCFREKMSSGRTFNGIVLYNGVLSYKIAEGLFVVPIQLLWQ